MINILLFLNVIVTFFAIKFLLFLKKVAKVKINIYNFPKLVFTILWGAFGFFILINYLPIYLGIGVALSAICQILNVGTMNFSEQKYSFGTRVALSIITALFWSQFFIILVYSMSLPIQIVIQKSEDKNKDEK